MQISSWEGSGNQDVDWNHIKNMKFDYVEDARSFYLGYARGNGFGIRATNLDYDCEVRVLRRKEKMDSDTLKYNLRVLIDDHSHKLATFREVSSHRSHKNVNEDKCLRRALVLFVGANNHSSTCVFGAALLLDEMFTSYKWALTKLMDSIGSNHPLSIMTDKDEAMRQAIDEKSSAFRSFIFDLSDKDKFDEYWKEMIKQHGLEDNVWVNMMYVKRHRWAETYSKGHFFARMRNTKRSKSMNSYMKEHVCSREKLFDLFPQIDRALMRLRNNFFTDEYALNSKSPVILSHLKSLEKRASSIYTYRNYYDITKEINYSIKYSHVAPWNEENEVQYVLAEYNCPYKKTVSVVYHRDRIDFQQVVEDHD
ncbi:hypothetical protein Dsin_027642 [Dipteronia sinensis]|uniref:Protein FAR1-RELATED SEQUENCE n=1 Tax=Dipteronia sinensis TaxID=43782 RepID=A0AAE0DTS3_9ROSI|nr:hypothetical protein Dsin_027642 [Dipteronia sinensis]